MPSGWPQVIVEGGFVTTKPVQAAGTLLLDDATYGLLGTGTLGGAATYSDLSAWVRSGTVTRPCTRQQGPLYSYSPGTAAIVLNNKDGRFDPGNLGGPYVAAGATELTAMTPVRLRAVWGGISYPLFDGYADGWADDGVNYAGHYAQTTLTATDAQKVLQGINLAAISPAGAGEATGTRVNRILTAAGWYTGTGKRVLAPGDSGLQATTFGDTAWNLMALASDSEIGELYVRGDGAVVFRNRHAILTDARSTAPQGVFGDVPGAAETAGTELAYRSVTRARDDATVANDVQATRAGGTLQEASDQASIDRYLFARTYTRSDLLLTADPETLTWAQWILYIAKADEDRFDQLVLYPLRDPVNLWPHALGREVGDRIQVWRRPPHVLDTTAPWTITSTGDTLGPSYIPVTTADAAKVNIGDQFQLYTSGGAPKDQAQWPLTVVALPPPFVGIVNVTFDKTLVTWVNNLDTAVQVTGAIVKDCFIRGISHDFDVSAGTWATTWTLQDASRYGSFWTLDQPILGKLDQNALAY